MSDWESELTPEERQGWDEFVQHFRRDALGKIAESAFVMHIIPSKDDVDVKFAVELGTAIMLDKPIMSIGLPGVEIPAKLRQISDVVVEADIDTEEGRREIQKAISALTGYSP